MSHPIPPELLIDKCPGFVGSFSWFPFQYEQKPEATMLLKYQAVKWFFWKEILVTKEESNCQSWALEIKNCGA